VRLSRAVITHRTVITFADMCRRTATCRPSPPPPPTLDGTSCTHRWQFSCNFSAFPVRPQTQPHQRVRGGALIARSDTRRARVTAPLPLSRTFARRRHHRRGAPSTRYYTLFARAPRTVFDAPRRGVGIGIFPPPSFLRPPTSRCRSGTVPTELLSMPPLAWSAWT